MDETNSVPVAYELRPLPSSMGPYEAGVPRAEPDIDHAAAALCRLVGDREFPAWIGRNAAAAIHDRLDPVMIGSRIRDRLAIVRGWFPRAAASRPR